MISRFFMASALAASCLAAPVSAADPDPSSRQEISFQTEDGITVYGDLYGNDTEAPLIVLFHQAGGNARAEYGPIIPVLLDQGYGVLAIDQRNGGSRLGGTNRTVDGLDGEEYGYCETFPDLVGALDFVDQEGYTGTLAVWGSSYSAALVIKLGAEYGERITAVLAFSPASGEPLADCLPEDYSQNLAVPALVLRPASEMERERVRDQLELFEAHGHRIYVAENGVHGSSMLNEDRVGADVEANWAVVNAFLHEQLMESE